MGDTHRPASTNNRGLTARITSFLSRVCPIPPQPRTQDLFSSPRFSRFVTIVLVPTLILTTFVTTVLAPLQEPVDYRQVTINTINDWNPVIAVDGNSIAHIVWVRNESLYYLNTSAWEEGRIASGNVSGRPSIFVDGKNVVYVAWIDTRNYWRAFDGSLEGVDVFYAQSGDGWIEHLVTNASDLRAFDPSIAVDVGGNVHVTYIRHTIAAYPYNRQLFYTNEWSGWLETKISDTRITQIASPSMAIDTNGVVHVAFSASVKADPWRNEHIFYANSSSGWNNVQIDTVAITRYGYGYGYGYWYGYWWDDRISPAIDVDAHNIPHIVWMDSRNTDTTWTDSFSDTGNRRQELYYANSSSGWVNTEIALPHDDRAHSQKREPSLVINDGVIHTVWLHNVDPDDDWGDVYYGTSLNWSRVVHVTDFESTGETIRTRMTQEALAVDHTGAAHIVWVANVTSPDHYEVCYVKVVETAVSEQQINTVPWAILCLLAIIVLVGTVGVIYRKAFRSTLFSS